jgi:hypothetical protein
LSAAHFLIEREEVMDSGIVLSEVPFCYPDYSFGSLGFLVGWLQHIPFYVCIAIFVYTWTTSKNEFSALCFRFYTLWWSLVVYALQWAIQQPRPHPECVAFYFFVWGMPCSETFYIFLICFIILLYYPTFGCRCRFTPVAFSICLPLLTFFGVVATGLNTFLQALVGACLGVFVAVLFCLLAYYVLAPLSPVFIRYISFGNLVCFQDTIWNPPTQPCLSTPCRVSTRLSAQPAIKNKNAYADVVISVSSARTFV